MALPQNLLTAGRRRDDVGSENPSRPKKVEEKLGYSDAT
jgi:hypothetical protein